MSSAQLLLDQVHALGVRLWAVDGRIKFEPASKLPPSLVVRIRERKAELLGVLTCAQTPQIPLDRTDTTSSAPVLSVLASASLGESTSRVDEVAFERAQTPLDRTDATRGGEVLAVLSSAPRRAHRWSWVSRHTPTLDQLETAIYERGPQAGPSHPIRTEGDKPESDECRSCSSPTWWRRVGGGPWICARCHPTPEWIAAETWSSAGGAS